MLSKLDAMTTITRRSVLSAMAVGGVGFALWPYRPRNERDIPADRIVATYWEKWTGEEGAAMQRVVDAFNDSQNRIWVHRVPVSNIVPKAMVAIGGGDAPDIVGLFNYNIPQFAESNAITPFDELTGAPLRPEHYAPAIRGLLTHEGRQWAGVSTCHTMALYYNRAHFRHAGLDPDRGPHTIDELDDFADRLTVRNGGSLERAGFMPNVPNWWPYFWPIMFGGRLYDHASNRATLSAPENVAAFEWAQRYPERYGRLATQTFASGYARSFLSAHDPFMTGKVSMVVQGPWMANFLRLFAPEVEFGCAPAPVVADQYDPAHPTGLLEADVLMIPRGCANPEAAFEFVQFVQEQSIQEQLATDHCKSSPLHAVSDGFTRDHPNPYVAVHDAIAKSPNVATSPRTRIWKQYSDMIGSAFEAIWAGADVTDQLRTTEARVQELLDTVARRREQRRSRFRSGAEASS